MAGFLDYLSNVNKGTYALQNIDQAREQNKNNFTWFPNALPALQESRRAVNAGEIPDSPAQTLKDFGKAWLYGGFDAATAIPRLMYADFTADRSGKYKAPPPGVDPDVYAQQVRMNNEAAQFQKQYEAEKPLRDFISARISKNLAPEAVLYNMSPQEKTQLGQMIADPKRAPIDPLNPLKSLSQAQIVAEASPENKPSRDQVERAKEQMRKSDPSYGMSREEMFLNRFKNVPVSQLAPLLNAMTPNRQMSAQDQIRNELRQLVLKDYLTESDAAGENKQKQSDADRNYYKRLRQIGGIKEDLLDSE